MLGIRNTELIYNRQNGFKFFTRAGFNTWTNGSRFFAGFATATTVISANPSALNNTIGFGVDSGDNGLIYVISKATGTVTKTSTTLTITSGRMYDLYMFCEPFTETVYYSITDLSTQVVVTGNITASLPTAQTLTTFNVLASNAALTTATATQISIAKIYNVSIY